MDQQELNKLIRKVAREAAWREPRHVTELVFDQLSPSQYESALKVCLQSHVRQIVKQDRNARYRRTLGHTPPISTQLKDELDRMETFFSVRVALPTGEWKTLGDCTAGELEAVAQSNDEQAEHNRNRAKFYRSIVSKMEERGVTYAKELSEVDVDSLHLAA